MSQVWKASRQLHELAGRITANKAPRILDVEGFSFLIGGEMKVQNFDGWYEHKFPGCNELHFIAVDEPFQNGQQWTFNGDVNKPTFSPSINIVGKCHYFIADGFIQYCSDSNHKLAGQTVELPDMG